MLHRTELQTIQKTVKSLTPSKPMCQTRVCPEPVSQGAQGTVEVMGKTNGHLLKAQVNSMCQLSRDPEEQRPSLVLILTVRSPFLIRSCTDCAFFLIFPKYTVRFPLPLEKENLPPDNSQAPFLSSLPLEIGRTGPSSLTLTPRFKYDLSKSVYNLNIH